MFRVPLALALLSAPVLGAGSVAAQAPTSASARTTPSRVAQAAGFPAGTYTATLTARDVRARMKSVPVDSMVGTWTLVIDSTGHIIVQRNGAQVVDAVAKAEPGHRLFFDATDTGADACKMPATYRYSLRGDHLTFRKVRDACHGRVAVLTSHSFVRRS